MEALGVIIAVGIIVLWAYRSATRSRRYGKNRTVRRTGMGEPRRPLSEASRRRLTRRAEAGDKRARNVLAQYDEEKN